jgi:WD40 repeat protein
MSSSDPSTGQGASTPADLRRQAQDSVRECVTSAAAQGRRGGGWVVPLAATAAVAAAACAPVVWPLLVVAGAGTGAAVMGAALTQVGGVGGGLLSEAVIRAWDRLRSRGQPDAGQADLRAALAAELEAGLTLDTPAAADLRDEVAGVLRGVEAVQVALTATVEESAAGVREVLVRGLRELGEEFTEFGWVLDEVNQQLTIIAEDVAQTAATTREVADNQQQTLVELALLRQEARSAFRYQMPWAGPAVLAGPSADEERAAALDAAGLPVSAECPYPGLAAFQPSDAERFFGREQLTAELVARAGEQLARPGLLMVVGPSGSGKSSLLRAGLLPAVAAGALPARGSWAWPRDLMTPGRRPLLELATRIASLAGIPAGALEADLRTDPARITSAVRQALLTNARRQANTPGLTPAADPMMIDLDAASQEAEEPDAGSLTAARHTGAGPRLVLIVDQFEEVFTQCTDENERRTFIKALCAAAGTATPGLAADGGPARGQVDARETPALVVIGIRADFYARTTAYPELAPHLQDHQVLVGPVDEAGLREAIEKPAATAGLVADAALMEVLLADLGLHARRDAAAASIVQDSPSSAAITGGDSYAAGRLALLSYALQQTWRNRDGRRLTVAGYRATGGIDGAVAQAADTVYNRLDPAGRAALQRTLLRLVTLGEGTPDTRRRVSFAELAASEDSAQATATRAVLSDLIDARLVTADADTVEITHETLLTAWPRLRQWLTEDRAGLRVHRDLTDAARDWQHQGRDPGRLFRGTRLAVARDWAAHHSQDLNANERAFLAASQFDQLRTTRRRRIAIAALAVLTALSVAAAGVALHLRGAALTARDEAIANQVAAEAEQFTATDPSLAAQLDIATNELSPTLDSQTRLLNTTTTPLASRLTGPTGSVDSVAFSPHRHILAAGSWDKKIWLWNLANPARPAPLGPPLTGPTSVVTSVKFSPDGHILAAGSATGKIWLWNLTDPARPAPLGPPLTASDVDSVAFSPDGHILAAGNYYDKRVWLWNLTNPARPTPLGPPLTGPASPVASVTFSPHTHILAVGSADGKVQLWNLTNPARPARLGPPLTGPRSVVASVAFSPDGHILAAGSYDNKVWLWNLTNPARPAALGQPLTGPTSNVGSVAFSPDGHILAAGSFDNKVWLWNLANPGRPTPLGRPLTGPTSPVESVAFSPDGHFLAAGSFDQTVRLWNLPSNVLAGPTGSVESVAFSPHRHILAAGSDDGKVRLWNLANPPRPAPLGPPLTASAAVYSVAFSPDGHILAAGSADGRVWLWNLTNPGRPAPLGQPLTGPTNSVSSVAFSLDGHLLAASSFDGTAQIWNLDVDAAIQRICATTSGALVPAQWKHYISQLPYDPPCARPGHYGLLVH